MRDVLFQCGHCSKHMCAGEPRIGRRFHCPDCAEPVEVPVPTTFFSCPACFEKFASANDLRDTDFLCPSCDNVIHIPRCTVLVCSECSVNIELDDELFAELSGTNATCPECGNAVPVPARPAAGSGSPAKNLPDGFGNKTVRLDEIIDSIPQAQHLRDGHCPYCNHSIEQMNETSFICRNCGRMIHTVKSKGRRSH